MKSSLKFCVVAACEFDGYVAEPRAYEWDIAAGHAIVKHAGGIVTTLDGKEFKYGKTNSNSYSMVSNGDICLSSFQDIYKPNFKVIADSANIAGAVSNNFGVLLAKSLTANGTAEEKNDAEKLKFYYYEFVKNVRSLFYQRQNRYKIRIRKIRI